MKYTEHILTYKAHKDNDYLNGLLSYMNEGMEDDDSEFTSRQNYFVELHYAKGRNTYPNKDCDVCEVEEQYEYVCIECEVNQATGEDK
tara:strand:- start:344 stop:607 length:264 start_codon:yes stop_codon:yes gene_type:complete